MKLKQRLTPRVILAFAMLVPFMLFGTAALPASAESPSYVRIIHASPDVGTADIFVDGSKFLASMAFATVTGYAQVPPGSHTVQIALVGKGIGAAVLTQVLAVQPGIAYTVAAIGTNATGLSLDVFEDNNLISTGMAKVRVYHLSPGTGTVSVAAGSNTVITGLIYPQASNYFALPAGSYTFNVTANPPNVSLPVAATLKMNTVTSVFAVGEINGTPQFQFVTSQVPGVPGVPGTGSDPNPQPGNAGSMAPITLWLLGVLALVGAGVGVKVVTRRVTGTRQK